MKDRKAGKGVPAPGCPLYFATPPKLAASRIPAVAVLEFFA
jgi:hypothetical protein